MAHRSTQDAIRIADRRRKVAALYLERRSQYDIARTVRVTQSVISKDLDAIRVGWHESALVDFNTRKAEELARIDHLEAEAWEAWHRSKKPAETETDKELEDTVEDGQRVKQPLHRTRKKEYRDGSAEYLKTIQWCIEQRCLILGLTSAKQAGAMAVAVAVSVEVQPPGLSEHDLLTLAELAGRTGVLGPAPALGTGLPA